ncbi:hypothetical protein [Gottfriedia sp. OAE603]|uniref:hypothetical protein n=1 Tax=Gottfriedia sp. OAE603 TaxID=2663872 RepID=UPI001A0D5A4C
MIGDIETRKDKILIQLTDALVKEREQLMAAFFYLRIWQSSSNRIIEKKGILGNYREFIKWNILPLKRLTLFQLEILYFNIGKG